MQASIFVGNLGEPGSVKIWGSALKKRGDYLKKNNDINKLSLNNVLFVDNK